MELTITNFYSNETVANCPKMYRPEYAFIGRSNVGKSSLINLLLKKKIAYTSAKPGKTQLINHILVNDEWLLVDLPGYGYARLAKSKRKQILERTQKYFKHRGIQLVGVFMLIDIRIPVQKIDLDWMVWLVKNNIYFIMVFTKCDGLNKNRIQTAVEKYKNAMKNNNWGEMPESIITSSKRKIGKTEILQKIIELNNLFQNI